MWLMEVTQIGLHVKLVNLRAIPLSRSSPGSGSADACAGGGKPRGGLASLFKEIGPDR